MAHKRGLHVQEALDLRRPVSPVRALRSVRPNPKGRLEIVLKCDSFGTVEAVNALLAAMKVPGVEIKVINSGVGPVSKSDLLMAETGSKLVVGFNVSVMPKLEQWVKEHGAEVRLYNVIYSLADDLRKIAKSFIIPEPEERITGKGRVIALFKSTHRGIILGCEVLEGTLTVGKDFRVITAMGPVYSGKIESLHIESDQVKEAKVGQRVGLKIEEFNRGKIGDFVECFENAGSRKTFAWRPKGDILHFEA